MTPAAPLLRAADDPLFDPVGVEIAPGATLVEASAGTGKTFALTGLVVRLVVDGHVRDLSRLLVVTFTVAANDELKGRIRSALADTLAALTGRAAPSPLAAPFVAHVDEAGREAAVRRLSRALQSVDAAAVSTIHGFCRRELEREAFASGEPLRLTLADEDEAAALHARAARDVWHALAGESPWLAALVAHERWDQTGRDVAGRDGAGRRLLDVYAQCAARPGVTVLPSARPLAEALAALEAAAQAYDCDGLAPLLADAHWLKNAPLARQRPDAVAAHVESLGRRPTPEALAAVKAVAGLGAFVGKSSAAQKAARAEALAHPSVVACAAIADALAEVRRAIVHAFVERMTERVAAAKADAGIVTHDDLLLRLHAALTCPVRGDALAGALAGRYDAALVDEFQDTDPVQAAIFERAFVGRPVFYVGDPKQAIYAFRGADLDAYLGARRAAVRRRALGTNWRSHSGLIRAVNALFAAPARPFVVDGIGHRAVEAGGEADAGALGGCAQLPFVWWTFEAEAGRGTPKPVAKGALRPRVVAAVVHEIRRLLGTGVTAGERPLRPSDLAVLVRSNREGETMQAALRAAGVASTVSRGGDVTLSPEMADVGAVLRAVARPHDAGALRAALATRLAGFSAADIADLDAAPAGWDRLHGRLHAWGRTWRRHGVLRMLEDAMRDWHVADRLLAHPDGERRMTNVRHVAELLHRAEAGGQKTPDDLVRWVEARATRRLGDREETELRLETDENAVQIVTIHKAKGLEYEVVFLPSLWDRRPVKNTLADRLPPLVPDGAGGMVYDLDLATSENRLAEAEARALAEDVRLVYVALTRARQRVYVVWGPANEADASGLAYLLHGHAATADAPAAHVAEAQRLAKTALVDTPRTLAAFAAAHADVMAVETLPATGTGWAPLAERDAATPSLRARRVAPDLRARLAADRVDSFSAWTRDTSDAVATAVPDAPLPDRPGTDEPTVDPATETTGTDAVPEGFDAFAGGARVGQAFHEILERTPPASLLTPLPDDARRRVRRNLLAHGLLAPEVHRAPIDAAAETIALLERLGAARLPGASFRLTEVTESAREWAFTTPLRPTPPAGLADVFARHGGPDLAACVPALARLTDAPRAGHFTGTADLVVAHEGRYGVFDWKTTRLDAYTSEAVEAAIVRHHYALQAVLYLAGLDAHLRARLPGYDYERDVMGAWVVFLRGVRADATDGIWHVKPPAVLVDAVGAAFRLDR